MRFAALLCACTFGCSWLTHFDAPDGGGGAAGSAGIGGSGGTTAIDAPIDRPVDATRDAPPSDALPLCTSSTQCDDGFSCTNDLCLNGRCGNTPIDSRCPQKGTCVSAHCTPSSPAHDSNGCVYTAIAGACFGNTPYCDLATGNCVECQLNSDCAAPDRCTAPSCFQGLCNRDSLCGMHGNPNLCCCIPAGSTTCVCQDVCPP